MEFTPINFRLVKHPMNWAVILLMLIIAAAIGHYVLTLAGLEPAKSKSAYSKVPAGQVPSGDAIDAINPQSAGFVS